MTHDLWRDPRVAGVRVPRSPRESDNGRAVEESLARLTGLLDWSNEEAGPFGKVIPRGARVLIKPNWVMHQNQGPWGLAPLVTSPALIRAVADGVLAAQPSGVLVGDAPIQGCDFDHLMRAMSVDRWAADLQAREPRFEGVQDFRRTTCVYRFGVRLAQENQIPEGNFVLFNIGTDSLLEPVTDSRGSFRVTQYDPREMKKTHAPGRHQYLVARVVLESDVVVNLPKLKTHSKAGVTAALKNVVGINGNKEFLPHHRLGGSRYGGDCYPGGSVIKRALELAIDQVNLAKTPSARAVVWGAGARFLDRLARVMGDRTGVEGAWSGNDTVWRTCLDLNRILLYGRPDGTLADVPQRRVLHIVDAIVAGQGEGPLAPEPLPLDLLLAGGNPAAVDWVGAQLLGYDPRHIPLLREVFGQFRWPIIPFRPVDVSLVGDDGNESASIGTALMHEQPVKHPRGWQDSVAGGRPHFAAHPPSDLVRSGDSGAQADRRSP